MIKNMDEDITKYDNEIEDIDELEGTDIKINPDYYIHNAINKAQASLNKDNLKDGILLYQMNIEHIEVLARASKMICEDYETKIKEYKETQEYKEMEETKKRFSLSNKKLNLILEQVFARKTLTSPLKF